MNAVIYARVSSDSQDVDLSISAQLRSLREYAARNGHEVIREFVDEAESGRTAARPAFRKMIALAKTKDRPFEAILVWKLNRFARSRMDSIVYKALLKDRGIKVISINEPLDDTPTGHLTEGMIEAIDQFYSENMGEDIKRGLRECATRGFFTGSKPPLGFRKVAVKDGNKTRYKLEPEPEDSKAINVVRRIFDMALKDVGCKEIAKALNGEGLRTGMGQRWGRTTVHKVLNNEAYCGNLVLGGRPGHSALRSGTAPTRVEGAWPAIIEKEVFNQIQAKMFSRRPAIAHPRTVPSKFLFSGLLFCSCGHAMIGRSAKSHQYHYYTCNGNYKQGSETCDAKSFPKIRLEQVVMSQIREKVLSEEWLEELVVLINKQLDSSHGLLKDRRDAIESELSDVRLRLSKLYDALETGKISLDDLAPRIREQREREGELSKSKLKLEAEIIAEGPNYVDAELIKSHAKDLKAIFEEADISASKSFLKTFIEKIVIEGDNVRIKYTLPVPPNGDTEERVSVLPIETPSGEGGI